MPDCGARRSAYALPMLLKTQLHLATDLVQSVIGALETDRPKLALHAAQKLARAMDDLHKSFFIRLSDEIRVPGPEPSK